MLGRDEALELVRGRIANPNLVKHMLATEAVMDALALRLGEDRELWSRTGLLHDLDLDVTEGDMARHGRVAYEALAAVDVPEDLRRAVLAHVGHVPAQNRLEHAVVAADPVTGLITAAALVAPSKKLADVRVESLRKRMKEKRFAANVNREQIARCSELGLALDEFLALSLAAMQHIAPELGL
ncbi:MAG: HDIG domain-containing protein [Deltaproteobacteria bacterium]|nr:HDIG domain-containing protein [Deltaproteobacteria bacterium]